MWWSAPHPRFAACSPGSRRFALSPRTSRDRSRRHADAGLAAPPRPQASSCDAEPIHIPAAIQPQGAFLAALADSGLVSHASANLALILGVPAKTVLCRTLEGIFGTTTGRELLVADYGDRLTIPGPHANTLHLHAFRSGRHLCIDIEPIPASPAEQSPMEKVQATVTHFGRATHRVELCQLAVRGLAAITGYDRVMAYRFAEDGHGEVIAEALADGLDPYLGLHYPASDVPPQARRLYLRQRVGAIANSSYDPVPLLVDPRVDDGVPLDLTHSALRSVSPIHREYMRNMKTAASLTIALVAHDELWGMLVCRHSTPRIAGPDLRAVAELIGRVVSLLLTPLGNLSVNARRLERKDALRALVNQISAPLPLVEAVGAAQSELLQLVDAAGAVLHIAGTTRLFGLTPPQETVESMLALLRGQAGGEVFAVDDLGRRFPLLANCASAASGALLLPLSPDSDDVILWCRPEQLHTISWGGNPVEHLSTDTVSGRLSPRASFAAWSHCNSRSRSFARIRPPRFRPQDLRLAGCVLK